MDTFQSAVVGDVTIGTLPSLTIPELAALYHEITGVALERFNNKESGIRRCQDVLERLFASAHVGTPIKVRQHAIDLPYRGYTRDPYSPKCLRSRMLLLLSSSPTIQECLDLAGGSKERLGWVLGRINREGGWGIREENGRLYLVDHHPETTAQPAVRRKFVVVTPDMIDNAPSQYRSSADADDSSRCDVDPGVVGCRMRGDGQAPHAALVGCSVASSGHGEDGRGHGAHPRDVGRDDPRRADGAAERVPGGPGDQEAEGAEGGDEIAEPRFPVHLHLTQRKIDRIEFLMQHVRAVDAEEVLIRALEYFDRAVCGVIDHARITARHRDGSLEDFDPR